MLHKHFLAVGMRHHYGYRDAELTLWGGIYSSMGRPYSVLRAERVSVYLVSREPGNLLEEDITELS